MNKKQTFDFFREKSAYRKFCMDCMKKYASFGQLTGMISLKAYQEEEIRILADFLGEADYVLIEKKKISIKKWLEQYNKTRFAEIPFEEVVSEIANDELIKKSELRLREKRKEEDFTRMLEERYPSLYFCLSAWKEIHDLYSDYLEKRLCEEDLSVLDRALCDLPLKNVTYLPLYANRMAGHPHAFDRQNILGSWFERLLTLKYESLRGISEKTEDFKSKAEQRHERMLFFGLLLDDISNFVTVNGVLAFTQEVQAIWKEACKSDITWNVPLKHLVENRRFEVCKGEKLWVVENSGLYSMLVSRFPKLSAICSHGQFKQFFWYMMEHFEKSTDIFYLGDFDPEGVRMADTFKRRYPDQVDLTCMNETYYLLSNPREEMEEKRLKKLDDVRSVELEATVQKMREKKAAGYQEELFDIYCMEIEKFLR